MPTSLQVLILEDNPSDAELFLHELRRAGFDPEWQRVETEEEYLAALHPALDIILSDYSLPQFDGLSALRLLRARGLDLPFILVSGTIGEEVAVECIKQGAADYLLKDRLTRLGPAVKSALEQKRLREERKRAEETLSASEVRYRRLFEAARDGILILDAETGMVVNVNPFLVEMLGYSREQFLGKRIWEIGFFKDIAANKSNFKELQQKEFIQYENLPLETAQGRLINVEFVSHVYQVDHHKVIQCNIRDITERKRVEDALQESEEKFKTLFNSANDAIFTMNHTTFLDCNVTTEKIFRCSKEQIVGHSPVDFSPERQPDGSFSSQSAVGKIEAAFAGEPQFFEWLHTHLDGTPFDAEVSLNRVFIGGEFILQAIVRDITERKQAEELIQKQVETLGALYDLSRTLAEMEDFNAILDLLTRCAVETTHVTFARVLLLENGDLVARAAFPIRMLDQDLQVGQREPLAAHPLYQRILEESTPRVLQLEGPEAGECAPFFLGIAQTLCVIPLRARERPLGLLMLGEARAAAREPFTADKIHLAHNIGDQAASTLHRALLHEETQRRLQHIQSLRAIDQAISGSLDLRLTLNVALEQTIQQLGVDAADVLLLNPHTQMLEYTTGRGFRSKAIERSRLRLGEGHAGRAALEKCTVSVHDLHIEKKEFVRADLLAGEDFDCYHSTPLISKGQVKGVLEVYLRSHRTADAEWLEFLETLAGQVAIAVDNANLFDGLQRSNTELVMAYDATIEGWSHAMDLRDKETEGHTLRVTELTLQLARAMGIGEAELVHVRRGALLHDMGKMGIPDSILHKPGALTDEEWKIMRQHPQFAYEMLSPVAYLRPALDIPSCHHEKWDGSGYPRGLKSEQIPLAARIFAVVDVYDALTSDRPYRAAWPKEKVLAHIQAGAGSHFDARVVEAFLNFGF